MTLLKIPRCDRCGLILNGFYDTALEARKAARKAGWVRHMEQSMLYDLCVTCMAEHDHDKEYNHGIDMKYAVRPSAAHLRKRDRQRGQG